MCSLCLSQISSCTTVRFWTWCWGDGLNWRKISRWRTAGTTSARFLTSMTALNMMCSTTAHWNSTTPWKSTGCPKHWRTSSYHRCCFWTIFDMFSFYSVQPELRDLEKSPITVQALYVKYKWIAPKFLLVCQYLPVIQFRCIIVTLLSVCWLNAALF